LIQPKENLKWFCNFVVLLLLVVLILCSVCCDIVFEKKIKGIHILMKYLAAYALCQLSGNAPTKAAVEAVLKAAGVAVDAERLTTLFAEFEGKDFDAVAAEGKKKLVGGSAAPAAAGAAPAAAAAAAPAAKAAAPAEEEEDDEMGFDLFG
jgi:large subunit ribosomal protein LP2